MMSELYNLKICINIIKIKAAFKLICKRFFFDHDLNVNFILFDKQNYFEHPFYTNKKASTRNHLLCLKHMLHASRLSTTPTQSLIRRAIFYQNGSPRQVGCLTPLWEYRRKVFSQGRNDTLHS